MKSINWPSEYLPRTTDNFVSNEAISNEITLEDTWINLVDTSNWETYYDNATNIELADKSSSYLHFAEIFHFDTFGFPIDAQVMEFGPLSIK